MVDISPINVGALPNDGLGDRNRTAWIKAVANFAALQGAIEDVATAVDAVAATAPAAATTLRLTALGPLPGGRFVAAVGNRQAVTVTPADLASPTGRALGYLATGAYDGAPIDVRVAGAIEVPGATWPGGLPVYLADDGSPTVVPRTSGWSQIVGTTTGAGGIALAIGPAAPAQARIATVAIPDLAAILVPALTDVVRALSLVPPSTPGVLWRSQTVLALSPHADGTPYIAPYGTGWAGLTAIDPITALLPLLVPRALRSLPTTPPDAAGVLWRNGVRIALTAQGDGTAYPTTPLPGGGGPLLAAVRPLLTAWLAEALPAMPLLPPISSGTPWRTADHALALSL
ncbi:hypothetical protein ACQVP2_28500 [Methylobacterium aquaticum]|uniref:hypothetical protein n=1 Tax=Methylobacterium aquaticum TaxID=270351 RepID=UPI003D17F8CB